MFWPDYSATIEKKFHIYTGTYLPTHLCLS